MPISYTFPLISLKGTLSVNNPGHEPCSPAGEIPAVFAQSDFSGDDEGRGHYWWLDNPIKSSDWPGRGLRHSRQGKGASKGSK